MDEYRKIVRDTAGFLYKVKETELEHAWIGIPVKLVRGAYVPKKPAIPRLIRKAGCIFVAHN